MLARESENTMCSKRIMTEAVNTFKIKFPNILIYFGVSLIPLTAAVEYKLECNVVQKCFNVCKHNDFLQSVRQLPCSNGGDMLQRHLYIKDTSISSIVSDAFDTLVPLFITELSLEFKKSELHLKPESFNGLKYLNTLNIISGIVEPTPNLFESLDSLTNLTLSFNSRSKYLKKSLSSLESLMNLKIINTNFSIITSNTFYNVAPMIKNLELYNNNISKIQFLAFSTFQNLETLKIVDNHLMNFEPGAILGLESLKSLEISRQPLDIISNNTFNNLTSLRNLKITCNMINKIESGAFSGLNLRTLDLSDNAIVIIESQSFYSTIIDKLILSGNPIFEIYKNAFVRCGAIGRIYLYNTTFTDINPQKWGIPSTNTIVVSNKL